MSQTLMGQPGAQQRVLIAGNGHVRKDYGVPNHVDGPVVSVGLIEVGGQEKSPSAYRSTSLRLPMWFSPRFGHPQPLRQISPSA